MQIALSSAHGLRIRGAKGFLDEVDESRKVVATVTNLLRGAGVTVRGPFNDDKSTTVAANISAIVNWHNGQKRDRDVSVHFNAFKTTTAPRGTECLHRNQPKLATAVSLAMATGGGFINRGGKQRANLGFLNRCKKPAVLLEVCFVDSSGDADLYRRNYDAICRGIASSIAGISLTLPPPVKPPVEPPPPTDRPTLREGSRGSQVFVLQAALQIVPVDGIFGPITKNAVQAFQHSQGLAADGIVGPRTWAALEAAYDLPPFEPPQLTWQEGIIATVFKDATTAYPPFGPVTERTMGVSLPWKFRGKRPQVIVQNPSNSREAVTEIMDVGPWLIDDDYWNLNMRPLAETCWRNRQPLPRGPHKGKIPNGAGIDLTPAAARAVGIAGKGTVNWAFVSDAVA